MRGRGEAVPPTRWRFVVVNPRRTTAPNSRLALRWHRGRRASRLTRITGVRPSCREVYRPIPSGAHNWTTAGSTADRRPDRGWNPRVHHDEAAGFRVHHWADSRSPTDDLVVTASQAQPVFQPGLATTPAAARPAARSRPARTVVLRPAAVGEAKHFQPTPIVTTARRTTAGGVFGRRLLRRIWKKGGGW